jgi:peptidoglycan/xylan/chitin deacetylase (PgdA/CDA1 family)
MSPPKLRRVLHVVAAVALHYSGILVLRRWFRMKVLGKDQVCVLGLHRVLTKAEQGRSNSLEGMVILDETYLDLLAHLQRRFEVISLDSFLARAEQNGASSKPQCVITFDDGWVDTYSRAFPGLRKSGLPATVFLATGTIGAGGGFWIERVKSAWRNGDTRDRIQSVLRERSHTMDVNDLETVVDCLKRMPTTRRDKVLESTLRTEAQSYADGSAQVDAMLTWQQAREMSMAGVEIGAHTVNHPLLTYEDKASVERELQLSKRAIEENLHTEARAFAYPNGDWNESVRNQVAEAGYQCAFTTRPAWYTRGENLYTISRVLLHEGNITVKPGRFSPAMLSLTVAGWA